MVKKVIIITFSLVLSLALIITYVHFSSLKSYHNNNVIKAVPASSFCVITTENIEELQELLTEDISFNKELSKFNSYKTLLSSVTKILKNKELHAIDNIFNNQISISLQTIGKSIDGLFLYALKNKVEENEFKSFLEDKLPAKWSFSKRSYNSESIYNIKIPNSKSIYLTFNSGILAVSYSSLLIENSIREVQAGTSFNNNKLFKMVEKTSGRGSDMSVLINFDRLPAAITGLFDRKYRSRIKALSYVGSWAELDLSIKKDKILMNGFIDSDNNRAKINQLFKGDSPHYSDIQKVIPVNASMILSYTFDSADKLQKNLNAFLENKEVLSRYKRSFSRAGNADLIFGLIDNEFGLINANDNNLNLNEGSYLIVQTKGRSKAEKNMKKLFAKPLTKVYSYRLDQDTKIPVYKNDKEADFKNIFSHFMPYTPCKYFSFYDNYMFFADNKESLSKILYANILKKTIYYNKYNKDFLDDFSSKDNMYFFCNISKIGEQFDPKPNVSLLNPNAEQKEALSGFYGVGLQLSANRDMLYTNVCVKYIPHRNSEPQTIWQSKLDSVIRNKPSFVLNHYTKENEIMVQDKSNKIYLITSDGRVLWDKKLDKPIISKIYQVDYYRNTKLQYLFNTEDRIYLLDRNGNNVEKYPVNLSSKATNGIALFDYSHSRNYRIFVATKNRKTSLYDIKGNKIMGWKAKNTEGTVTQDIQYINEKGKDYIVLADDSRNYILNRKGENRVSIKEDFVRNAHSKVFQVNGKLVTTDKYGNLKIIDLSNGDVKTEELLDNKEPHFFTCLKNGGKNQYIIVTANKLLIYDDKYNQEAEVKVDGALTLNADIYHFSATESKIGVYDYEKHDIYLINSDGSLYKNFPLKGTSRFSIGFLTKKRSNFNLVVGGENNYLYNYTVQ